jgi:hypothetical protein
MIIFIISFIAAVVSGLVISNIFGLYGFLTGVITAFIIYCIWKEKA